MIKQFFILALIVLLISACCDDSVEVAKYELSKNVLAMIPYKEGDKIGFIHSNGYEFNLETKSRVTEWKEQHPFCEWSCCGNEYFSYQINTTVLQSVYPKFEIVLSVISAETYVDYYYESNSLSIKINSYESNMYYDSVTNFICIDKIKCYDSLVLNNQKYFDVIETELKNYWIEDSTTFKLNSILYNKQFGILQIKTSNNETYTIK